MIGDEGGEGGADEEGITWWENGISTLLTVSDNESEDWELEGLGTGLTSWPRLDTPAPLVCVAAERSAEDREEEPPHPPEAGHGGLVRPADYSRLEARPIGFEVPTATPGVAPHRRDPDLWLYRRWLALEDAGSSVVVAADAWSFSALKAGGPRKYHVTKRFRAFQSMREFYSDYLVQSAHRNFYELIPPRTPVKLYLDLEWISRQPEDGRIGSLLQTVSAEIDSWWPGLGDGWKDSVWILKGGRWKDGGYKNSYHVVYAALVFESNTGVMKRFVQHLTKLAPLKVRAINGTEVSIVDPKPYSKWQAYRLPLCWKLDDHSCTELRFVDRQCTLASLLAATASYVPAGSQPNITNDPSDDVMEVGWDVDEILRTLQLDGGHPGSARLLTGSVTVSFSGCWSCPASRCRHDDGTLLLGKTPKGVEVKCSHSCETILIPGHALEERDCSARQQAPNMPVLPCRSFWEEEQAEESRQVRAVVELGWLSEAAVQALWDESLWQHTVIKDGADVRAIFSAGAQSGVPLPDADRFFLYGARKDTSPSFVVEICVSSRSIYSFASTGSFHVGARIVDWLDQGKPSQPWTRRAIGKPLCYDPRNFDLLTWANLRRRDWGLALLDGRHAGVCRAAAAILLAKRWVRTTDDDSDTDLRRWMSDVSETFSGIDDPSLQTDRMWEMTGQKIQSQGSSATVGSILRKLSQSSGRPPTKTGQPAPRRDTVVRPLPDPVLDGSTFTSAAGEGAETRNLAGNADTTFQVVSQNLGPLGIQSSWSTVEGLLADRPAVALFQDCRVRAKAVPALKQQLSEKFPGYYNFVTTQRAFKGAGRFAYPVAMVTLIMRMDQPPRLCSSAEVHWVQPTELDGRLQIIRMEASDGSVWAICNVYNFTAGNAVGQSLLLDGLCQACGALLSLERVFLILGGDWNATEHTGLRHGYCLVDGQLHPDIVAADAKLGRFLGRIRATGRSWHGVFRGEGHTRRAYGRKARLDDVYLASPTPTQYTIDCEWGTAGHDHAAVAAQFRATDPGFRRQASALRVECLDKRKWEANLLSWQKQVSDCLALADSGNEGDVFEKLQQGVQVAWDLAPKRVVRRCLGERRPRSLLQAESRHNLLSRAQEELKEENWEHRNWHLRKAIRKGLLTHDDSNGQEVLHVPTATWHLRLADALQDSASTLKAERTAFRKNKLVQFKNRSRTRMARPRSGEIKKLMGKTSTVLQPPIRHAKAVSLRHPNGVTVHLTPAQEAHWFDLMGLPLPTGEAGYSVSKGLGRWEISRSPSVITIRVSPLTEVFQVLQSLPSDMLSCTLIQDERLEMLHPTDSRAHEETFFCWNATAAGSTCQACHATNLFPITRENEGRTIVHFCKTCYHCHDNLPEPPAAEWPFEPEVFTRNVLTEGPVFKGALAWDEFQVLLHTRPPDKAPFEDMMTYEIWKAAPEVLQRRLFEALNAALEGQQLPDDWLEANIRLLAKKEGYEHLLEFLRPVCLLPTKTKLYTSVITHRLSSAFEGQGVFHPAQEGNRQRRNTRRQCLRLEAVKSLSKRQGKTLYVAYLDFRNYFNALPINKMLLLLRRLGVPEDEVLMLKQYYQHATFSVKSDDGRKSAKIPLKRGVKQGDPLSPLLAAVVAEVFSRRLDLQGLGIPLEEDEDLIWQISHLFFVDDLALLAWSPETMQRYLKVVEELCKWLDVEVNMEKTEIAAFDYKRGVEVSTRRLLIDGQPLKRLAPDAAFKYLGIRLVLTGTAWQEKEQVLQATRDAARQFRNHPYSPSQVHWLVESTVISLFRYSSPFVDWTPEELEAVTKEWVTAYRFAHHLPPSTPESHFRASKDRGGLGVLDAVAVMGRECMSVLQQGTVLKDDLPTLLRGMTHDAFLAQGCTSWEEYSVELQLSVTPTTPLDSIFSKLAWASQELDSDIDWSLLTGLAGGPGLMSISHQLRRKDRDEEGSAWVRFLRSMVALGFTEARMVVFGNEIRLPAALNGAGGNDSAARELAAVLRKELVWAPAGDGRGSAGETLILEGDRAEALLGGRVRWPVDADTFREGVVYNYDPDVDLYEVQLLDGDPVVVSLEQLARNWDFRHRPDPVAWQELGVTVAESIEHISAHRVVVRCRQHPNPLPHLQVSREWVQEEIEYECQLHNGYDNRARHLAGLSGSNNGKALATHLCGTRKACWFYQELWPDWPSAHQGWWVVFTGWEVVHREVIVHYTTLDPATEHRSGSITVEEARIIVRHMGQRAVYDWMSERELGQDPSPEVQYHIALQTYWAASTAGLPREAAARCAAHADLVGARPSTPFWAPRHGGHPLDGMASVQLEVEWEYDKVHTQHTASGTILTKGSRAAIKVGTVNHAQPTTARPTLRRAGPRTKQAQSFPLEAARVQLLERRSDDVIRVWKAQWEAQVSWEAAGGRTLSWAIGEHLRHHGDLQTLLTPQLLTAYPAFEVLDELCWPQAKSAVVALSEMGERLGKAWDVLITLERWAVIVCSKDVSQEQKAWLKTNGSLWEEFNSKDAVVYRKGWWQSGERFLAKPKCKLQIWVSAGLTIPSLKSDGQLAPGATVWVPPVTPHHEDLTAYLAGQPSARYAGVGHSVAASDGSLRKVDGIRLMGAAVAHGDSNEVFAVRIGGACSSTRTELVGILLTIESAPLDRELWILVDSSSAISRLSWFRRETFRPPGHRVKDADVVYDILNALHSRMELVKLIKVNGHMGDPLHSAADEAAVRVTQDADAEFRYAGPPPATPQVRCPDGKVKPWPSSVVRAWNAQASVRYWHRREALHGCSSTGFLGVQGVGRRFLGAALRDVYDWAIRDWIRLVNPILLPTLDSKVKWKVAVDASCTLPRCQGGAQTMVHIQLQCLNEEVKNTRQAAHDRVVEVLQRAVTKQLAADMRSAWAPMTVSSFWPEGVWPLQIGRLQPDGLVEDTAHKIIWVLEVARTMDSSESFDGPRSAEKQLKYDALCQEIKRQHPEFTVFICEFVIGIRGSLPAARWAMHLARLGLPALAQKQVMTDAIQATIEGSARVLTAWKRQSK